MRQVEEIEHTQMKWEDNNTTCHCLLTREAKNDVGDDWVLP